MFSRALRADRDRGWSGNDDMAGVEGLLARPLFVITVAAWMGTESPFVSASSRFATESFRWPMAVSITPGVPLAGSLRIGSPFVLGARSFVEDLTSGRDVRPLAGAAAPRSGVLEELPLDFPDAARSSLCRLLSMMDWVEFCLALDEGGLPPLIGCGEPLPVGFKSGKVLRIGEEANDGDIADVIVLFLSAVSSYT